MEATVPREDFLPVAMDHPLEATLALDQPLAQASLEDITEVTGAVARVVALFPEGRVVLVVDSVATAAARAASAVEAMDPVRVATAVKGASEEVITVALAAAKVATPAAAWEADLVADLMVGSEVDSVVG